MTTRPHKVLPV